MQKSDLKGMEISPKKDSWKSVLDLWNGYCISDFVEFLHYFLPKFHDLILCGGIFKGFFAEKILSTANFQGRQRRSSLCTPYSYTILNIH